MPFHITGDPDADAVLDEYPFALLVGMMLDQQYAMEHAFRGPWKVLSRFGTLDPAEIADAEPDGFAALCRQAPAIHRFPGSMAGRMQELARVVVDTHDGDAARVWNEASSGKELLARLTGLPGFGEQKARIFVALLGKQAGVRPRGWKAAAGDYGLTGYRSVADVVGPESLAKVRAYKQQKKAAASG